MPLSGATMTRSRRGQTQSASPSRRRSSSSMSLSSTSTSSADLSSIVMRQLKLSSTGPSSHPPAHQQGEQKTTDATNNNNSNVDEDVATPVNNKETSKFKRGAVVVSVVLLLLCLLRPLASLSAYGTRVNANGTDLLASSKIGQDDAFIGESSQNASVSGEEDEENEGGQHKNIIVQILDHPAMLVADISLLVFSHGILGAGAAARIGMAARGGSKFVTSVLFGPLRQNSAAIRRVLVGGPKQLVQGTGNFLKSLYKNRSFYSTLSDYTWYLDAEASEEKNSRRQEG